MQRQCPAGTAGIAKRSHLRTCGANGVHQIPWVFCCHVNKRVRDLNIIVIELIVVLGVALGLGFWQLYDVSRELRKDKEKSDDQESP